MLNNCNKQECGFADDIVAYIYDEIGQNERRKFESHLAGCTACTDEFAGISNARFSVFEWRREEFANLPTPEIVIPYVTNKRDMETAGFFSGLRDLLTLSGWSSAVIVAGTVVICIGLGFVAINFLGSNQQVAENKKTMVNDQIGPPVISPRQQNVTVAQAPQKERTPHSTTLPALAKSMPSRDIRRERASIQVRRIREKNLTARTLPVQPSNQQKHRTPALTAYDDEDDKSLRLADLFDEGGS